MSVNINNVYSVHFEGIYFFIFFLIFYFCISILYYYYYQIKSNQILFV